MRHNHNKHAKRPEDIYLKCDVVYADLPQISGVYRLDVLPLKTIYINRAADERTFYRHVF